MLGAVALVGAGVFLWLRRPSRPAEKSPGDSLMATITFSHLGMGQSIWVGFGYAKDQPLGFGDISNFTNVSAMVKDDQDWTSYEVEVPGKIPELPAGPYDFFVFIQEAGGELRHDGKGFIAARWLERRITIL